MAFFRELRHAAGRSAVVLRPPRILPCLLAAATLACGAPRRVAVGDASVAIGILGQPDAQPPGADVLDPFAAFQRTVTPPPPSAVVAPELADQRIRASELPSIVVSLSLNDEDAAVAVEAAVAEEAAVVVADDAPPPSPSPAELQAAARRREAEAREAARVEAERAAKIARDEAAARAAQEAAAEAERREAAARAETERREAAARAETERREAAVAAAARAQAEADARRAAAEAEARRRAEVRAAAAREAAAREAAVREAAAREAAAREVAAREASAREAAARAAAEEAAARVVAARESARREAAARRAAEESARVEAARRAAADLARQEAARRAAAEAARQEAARLEAERQQAAREAAARRAEEEAARAATARRVAAEAARAEAARRAEALAARRASETAAQQEAARLAAERAAQQEAARRVAAEAARVEAARLAAAEAARQEAARVAAVRRAMEQTAREEAARRAAALAAEQEAARRAVALATQQEAARRAAERAAQEESARRAAAEAARAEAARRAAAEAARLEAARRAAAEAARAEAARRAAAEAARQEAARRAAAEAAQREAARVAAAEAARQEAARQEAARAEAARQEAVRREQARALAARPTAAPVVAPATPPAPRRALSGQWRRLPRVTLTAPHVRARWDDPPDFDGDGLPDPILAVEYHAGGVACRAVASSSPCAPIEATPAAEGRPLVLAFIGMFSGDAAAPGAAADAAVVPTGRLLGTRRFEGRAARVTGAEFSEFGPGLLVRTLAEAHEGTTVDAIDVVDVFTGVGLDRRAGAIVHHCLRRPNLPPVRHATLSVALPALTPLVWRAATSHPYSGCAVGVESLDIGLGAPLLGDVRVSAFTTERAPPNRAVAIAVAGGHARVVPHGDRDPTSWGDPLALGPVRVFEMTRGCQWDTVRYERDGRRCRVNIPRHDDPLPGCEERASPLDPEPPRPLWLHSHLGMILDGGVPTEPLHLVFARGGALWDATFPLTCQGEHRAHAASWSGEAPAGVAVSPRGDNVLFGTGDDLWLFTRGRRVPYLLNPPGGALPRLDVRAVAFIDDTHVAAVLSGQFVTFEVAVPAAGAGVPEGLTLDDAEVSRVLRAHR